MWFWPHSHARRPGLDGVDDTVRDGLCIAADDVQVRHAEPGAEGGRAAFGLQSGVGVSQVADRFAEGVRTLVAQGKPVAITEFGIAAFRGAGDLGGRFMEIVEYDKNSGVRVTRIPTCPGNRRRRSPRRPTTTEADRAAQPSTQGPEEEPLFADPCRRDRRHHRRCRDFIGMVQQRSQRRTRGSSGTGSSRPSAMRRAVGYHLGQPSDVVAHLVGRRPGTDLAQLFVECADGAVFGLPRGVGLDAGQVPSMCRWKSRTHPGEQPLGRPADQRTRSASRGPPQGRPEGAARLSRPVGKALRPGRPRTSTPPN